MKFNVPFVFSMFSSAFETAWVGETCLAVTALATREIGPFIDDSI